MAENTAKKFQVPDDLGEQDFVESNEARLNYALDRVVLHINKDANEKKRTYLKDSEVPAGGE